MIKLYFKQAWCMLSQNRLYSSVYIIGTGMAVAMTLIIMLIYYVQIAPAYPEVNRNRTLVADKLRIDYRGTDKVNGARFSYQFVQDHIYTLETPEAVTAILNVWEDYPLLEMPDGKHMLPVSVKYVDHFFWKVFEFDFLDGKAFAEPEFQSGIQTAVITASLAQTLFGTTEAEGKRMNLDGNDYRVSGVVRDVSQVTPVTYAQIWVPFTVRPEDIAPQTRGEGLLGAMTVYMLARSASETGTVKAETDLLVQKINNSQEKYTLTMSGAPDTYWKSVFRRVNSQLDWFEIFKVFGVMLLALLIVPAVNLAGLISSQMEKRLVEMGIRKAFGASRRKLMSQILVENFLFTLLGGVLGLLLSYFVLWLSKEWILTLFDRWVTVPQENAETVFTVGMFFNPTVFVITLCICFLLNYISAVIPAYNGLRKTIIYSLNHNK